MWGLYTYLGTPLLSTEINLMPIVETFKQEAGVINVNHFQNNYKILK
jgi:hypothetical protein